MAFSYSLHLSNKSNAITTTNKIAQASRHNLRGYKSDKYDRNQISVLTGSQSILDDIKQIYEQEFGEALKNYNEKQTRDDRKIKDYLEHVSNSRNDVAAEIIIQVGDMDFWKDKTIEDKKVMEYIFSDQLRSLRQLCPDFKIASAVIHYDESSPHMHVIGVPVASGYKKGLEKQCAKTKIFTIESLAMLQEKMRERAARGVEMNKKVFGNEVFKAKEKGRNKDIPTSVYREYDELKKETSDIEKELVDGEHKIMQQRKDLTKLKEMKAVTSAVLDNMNNDFSSLQEKLAEQDMIIKQNNHVIEEQNANISSQKAQIRHFMQISDNFLAETSEEPFTVKIGGVKREFKPIKALERAAEWLQQKISGLKEKINELTSRKEKLVYECEQMDRALQNVDVIVSEKLKADKWHEMQAAYNECEMMLHDDERAAFENLDINEMGKCTSRLLTNMNENRPGIYRKYARLTDCLKAYLDIKDRPTTLLELQQEMEQKSFTFYQPKGRTSR